jgi:hypothetical protein
MSQRSATSSSRVTPGDGCASAAFWSQAVASQLPATVTGSAAPMTKPKKRGPAIAIVAGETSASRRASTAAGSAGPAGGGSSSASSAATAAAVGATARAPRPSK